MRQSSDPVVNHHRHLCHRRRGGVVELQAVSELIIALCLAATFLVFAWALMSLTAF